MNSQIIDAKAYLIFDLLESLDLPFSFEASFKMTQNTLMKNRFILGIENSDKLRENILYICQSINMPNQYLEIFLQNLPNANMISVGFESDAISCMYKAYLEFWGKTIYELKQKYNKTEPVVLYLGFKWNALDNTKGLISKYRCHPLLAVEMILQRISGIYQDDQHLPAREIVKDIINLASQRANDTQFIYLEVSEENNQRKSFDINLYPANLQLQDIQHYLGKMCQHYAIPTVNFNSLYQQINTKTLGHLSGGIDRQGREFLTLYYQV